MADELLLIITEVRVLFVPQKGSKMFDWIWKKIKYLRYLNQRSGFGHLLI